MVDEVSRGNVATADLNLLLLLDILAGGAILRRSLEGLHRSLTFQSHFGGEESHRGNS